MRKTFIICVLTIKFHVFISAQTLYKNSERVVERRCLQDPYIKTSLLTECVLECQNQQLHPIHKEDECFCVENECLDQVIKIGTIHREVTSKVNPVSKYQGNIIK